jgi:MHS family proline/betaine transporter-like MFS transporter
LTPRCITFLQATCGLTPETPTQRSNEKRRCRERAIVSIIRGQTMTIPSAVQAVSAARPFRDRAPTAIQSRKAIYAAGIGNVMEWYDFNVFAFMAAPLARNFFPGSDAAAGILSTFAVLGVGLVVRPLGGLIIGRMGDVRGRKPALIMTILLMAVGTAMIGVLPNYASIGVLAPGLLVVARMMQGFSTGGEWGGATTFMTEWSQPGRRGYFTSLQQLSNAVGLLLGSGMAALVTTFLSADSVVSWGWRTHS